MVGMCPITRTPATITGCIGTGLCRPSVTAPRLVKRLPRHIVQTNAENGNGSNSQSKAASVPTADDTLKVDDLRSRLQARPSPFFPHKNFGGGFVYDGDKVALTALKYESDDSAGARCPGILYAKPNTPVDPLETQEMECEVLPTWAVRAGARERIYFDPKEVNAAVVTCGGLCPGLNDVVQGVVHKLLDYGVPEDNILGIRYGFRGFYSRDAKPVKLTRQTVDGIHLKGGTILGTSRGGADIDEIVKRVDMWGIDMLFVVGGNGGNAGANAIHQKCIQRGVACCVVGVPKSIDNDILLIDKCFGFDTAVEEAQRALIAAKVEAESARCGIGLVKLMGRQSGFIAMQASMASGVVDVCLIPECSFEMEGEGGLLAYIGKTLKSQGHCVVCVAEGAGQKLLAKGQTTTDASGNPILEDIGVWMRKQLKSHFKDADIKYIDPTYMIRAIPTTAQDRIYCKVLAHNAVHAAFAGYSGATVGLVNTHYVYLPISTIIQSPRRVDPTGAAWNRLRAAIGQPSLCNDDSPNEHTYTDSETGELMATV